jgi:NAD(P)-dependent dehydrogenase (short-subunit alcohol dehydrogenase family)
MANLSFDGQVAVVTGAGGGLGRCYALEIARLGGAVVVNDLGGSVSGQGGATSHHFADTVVEEIRAAGGRAVASYNDVATAEGGKRIIEAALDNFGRIDAVVANAGNFRMGAVEDTTLDDFMALHAVHVGGSWNVARAAWPHLRAQAYGRIVFTTSSAAMFGNALLPAYGAAKGGVMGLMHALAEAGKPHGILCNAVMPNALSRMTSDIKPGDLGDNPWGRGMARYYDPRYTQGLVAFLASRECTRHHTIFSALGGRIGRTFVGVTDGVIDDALTDPDVVAARLPDIVDAGRGFDVPTDVMDEFRIVAGQRVAAAH